MESLQFEKLYSNKIAQSKIQKLCSRYFKKYKNHFLTYGFDFEDLQQEIWVRLLESNTDPKFFINSAVNHMHMILRSSFSELKDVKFDDINTFALDLDEGEETEDEILGRLVYHKKARYLTV